METWEAGSLNIMTNATKRYAEKGVRVVPGASARYGSFISSVHYDAQLR
jgi:2,3,4,5-tetrahydropyridine-2-carboxylate N-succinyltransferase